MAWSHVASVGNGATGASVTIAKANLSGLANDDVVVVALSQYNDTDATWSNDDGFTIIDTVATTAGADGTSAIAYKVMTDVSSEPTTWSFYNTYSSEKAAAASVFRGVDTASPLDVTSATDTGTNDGTPPGRDITTLTNGAMVVTTCHLFNQSTTPVTTGGAPSGFTLGGFYQHIGNDFVIAAISYLEKATAGLQTVGDWTHSPGETISEWHCKSLALAPDTAGPGGSGNGTLALLAALE